jgi:hypothetical protein
MDPPFFPPQWSFRSDLAIRKRVRSGIAPIAFPYLCLFAAAALTGAGTSRLEAGANLPSGNSVGKPTGLD